MSEAVSHLLSKAHAAVLNHDSTSLQHALHELNEVGVDAIPPKGHICKYCNRPGQLYCYDVAVKRARGLEVK